MYLNYVSWPESPVSEVSELADRAESSPGEEKWHLELQKAYVKPVNLYFFKNK